MNLKDEETIIKVPRFNAQNGFTTSKERSVLMSKIKGKNTKPELLLRKALWAEGLRYRLHNKTLPGNPDLVFKQHKVVVFIDGEFWHGFEWEKKREKIKANREFWIAKIERNMQRDASNNAQLASLGYCVIRLWDRDIKNDLNTCVLKIMNYLQRL